MFDKPAFKTLVLGVGNKLMSDEGAGVHVVEHIAAGYRIPEEVQLLDGGTLGMDLLYYLENTENLLLVDAVEAHKTPGTIIRLEGEEVPTFLSIKISPHQIGVPDMLAAARLMDVYPKKIILWGIQPELMEIGLDLSPLLESKLELLVRNVIDDLKKWGHVFE